MKKVLALILLFHIGFTAVGFSEEVAQIQVIESELNGQVNRMKLDLQAVPAGNIEIHAMAEGEGAFDLELIPSSKKVWILIDTSKFCKHYRVDQYLQKISTFFKKFYSKESSFSVAEYFSGEVRVKMLDQSFVSFEKYEVKCQRSALSSNYEEALISLLNQWEKKEAPDQIWVLSSGNIKISEEFSRMIEKRDLNVHVGIYNPYILRSIESTLVEQPVSFSQIFDLESSQWFLPPFQAEFDVKIPDQNLDQTFTLAVQAKSDDKVVGQVKRSIFVSSQGLKRVYRKNFAWVAWGVFGFFLLLVIALLVRKNRTRICRTCEMRLRKEDRICFQCAPGSQAFLVEKSRSKVFPVLSSGFHFGSSRSSDIRIRAARGNKRSEYVISEIRLKGGGSIYFMKSDFNGKRVRMDINGYPLMGERLVGNGDQIDIDGRSFTFVVNGKISQTERGLRNAS